MIRSIALLLTMILFACKSPEPSTKTESPTPLNIPLDNGKKWKVNPEMLVPILDAEKEVDLYISSKSKEYSTLANSLSLKNKALIQSCTMKGERHDALHLWLHPHMKLVKKLSKAKKEQAQELILQLKTSFNSFHQYFE